MGALIDVVEAAVKVAWVDAYSDYRRSLPQQVAGAEELLRTRGAMRRRSDPGMAIEIKPGDGEGWHLLRTYGAWSIHMELELNGPGRPTATCHDCGLSITADLTEAEAACLAAKLPAGATLHRLAAPPPHRQGGHWLGRVSGGED
ncbi:hypothetical protein [Pseudactinotalea terrae]|uniref:hypothetical protein n=1 Tax=Pseudactinotalea terrae TaxID=1743262 RepID=UPI0012E1AF74|nr:hypothetical protein [Pseudactinotalea terrae]